MKNNLIVLIKNIFMYITLIWSSVMAIVYLIILFELPFFALISYLPLGESLANSLAFLLLIGIWVVPVLYVITVILIIIVYQYYSECNPKKRVSLATIILPLALTVLMFATNFLERLS